MSSSISSINVNSSQIEEKKEQSTQNPITEVTGVILKEARRKSRCATCNRSITLAQSQKPCRCTKLFCDAHSPCEKHGCTFDFKAAFQEDALNKEMHKAKKQKLFHGHTIDNNSVY